MSGFDEFHKLEVDFKSAPVAAYPLLKAAVTVAAQKGKKAWQEAARAHRYAGAYPSTIDYDPVDANLETDLGPNLNRRRTGPHGGSAAGLGILEDSEKDVNGPPQRNYIKAEAIIEEDLPRGIEIAIDQSLKGLGL